jgi:hypothetical protein
MDSRRLSEFVAAQAQRPPREFIEWLDRRLEAEPRCPITHYLLGCHGFDRGRPAPAVRHMMIAHHAEPALESAALLVFAGLNWVSRRTVALLPVLLDTWEEFRRPEFDRRRAERRLLDAFARPQDGLNGVSPLARRLWRLPIGTLRAQIRDAVLSPMATQYSLLLAPVCP